MHVYIRMGLLHYIAVNNPDRIEILDMGFGTGLNALLTESMTTVPTLYRTVEKYPILLEDLQIIRDSNSLILSAPWNTETAISPLFTISKTIGDIREVDLGHPDIVYWDAFDPVTQPELWTAEIFTRLFNAMPSGSILVTYSAKGVVKQALRTAGFIIERLEGALGKHHMLRATRL